jgi:hypothetical protein
MPTPIPFADDGGTPRLGRPPRLAARTTLPDLAVLLARSYRATAPAEVRGGGVLVAQDVLRGRYGTTGRCHCANRHSRPPWQP